ncbi:MAG: hypothetical protein AAB360_03555 [Patescibacteria group bacterium]
MKEQNQPPTDIRDDLALGMNQARLKSPLPVWAVMLLLSLIFFLCLGLLWWGRNSWGRLFSSSRPSLGLADKPGALNQENMTLSGAGEMRVSEEQLAEVLKLTDDNFPLVEPSLRIGPDSIRLKGRAGRSFLSLRVETRIQPAVENGQLKFKIAEMKAAGLPVPSSVASRIQPKLEQFLTDASRLAGTAILTEVGLFERYMILYLKSG